MRWERVCRTDDVQPERPCSARVDGRAIGIYRVEDSYHALEDICPHAYALLSEGFVEDGRVECPLHEAVFDIRTGRCLQRPADRDLVVYPLRVVGADIEVQVPDGE